MSIMLARLLAPLLLATSLFAQATPSPSLSGIAHVAIRVKDLDASVGFYEKLGFVRAFALSKDGKVYEAFIKINDHQFIELYPATEKDPQIGFLHLCFYGADLNSVHDFYVAQGLTPNQVRTAGAGNLLFTMPGPLSPTGPQNIEYTQYMPGSLHSKDVGQHLGPDRIANELTSVTLAFTDPPAAKAFYLDKMHFPSSLTLPGASTEAVAITPLAPLGHKARFTLAADPRRSAATLQTRLVPFTRDTQGLLLLDPDQNEIVIAPQP